MRCMTVKYNVRVFFLVSCFAFFAKYRGGGGCGIRVGVLLWVGGTEIYDKGGGSRCVQSELGVRADRNSSQLLWLFSSYKDGGNVCGKILFGTAYQGIILRYPCAYRKMYSWQGLYCLLVGFSVCVGVFYFGILVFSFQCGGFCYLVLVVGTQGHVNQGCEPVAARRAP